MKRTHLGAVTRRGFPFPQTLDPFDMLFVCTGFVLSEQPVLLPCQLRLPELPVDSAQNVVDTIHGWIQLQSKLVLLDCFPPFLGEFVAPSKIHAGVGILGVGG